MSGFDVRTGSAGLRLADVAHLLVPGRGRDGTGRQLSAAGRARVDHAADLYLAIRPPGRVVCSGYRTPGDTNGGRWSPGDGSPETFVGVPEADSMRSVLLARGVPDAVIAVERHSVDTVTNFVRTEAEGHFGDDRPVAIVAQESHLERILTVIAPRVLHREFLGVVVPEPGRPEREGRLPALVSRYVLRGLRAGDEDLLRVTERRIAGVWRAARRFRPAYHTDAG